MTPEQANIRALLLPGVTNMQATVDVQFDDAGNLRMVGRGPNGALLDHQVATAEQVETGEYKVCFTATQEWFWPYFTAYLDRFERERTQEAA